MNTNKSLWAGLGKVADGSLISTSVKSYAKNYFFKTFFSFLLKLFQYIFKEIWHEKFCLKIFLQGKFTTLISMDWWVLVQFS